MLTILLLELLLILIDSTLILKRRFLNTIISWITTNTHIALRSHAMASIIFSYIIVGVAITSEFLSMNYSERSL